MRRTQQQFHFPVGTRVYHMSGRFGTVVGQWQRHNGYPVTFDERRQFEPDRVVVRAMHMTPVGEMHEAYEAAWPAFVQRERQWVRDMPEDAQ